MEDDMIQRFVALLGRLDGDLQGFDDLRLADDLVETLGPEGKQFGLVVDLQACPGHHPLNITRMGQHVVAHARFSPR
jgi:hypothetical protein